MSRSPRNDGFTLVEVLTALAILGLSLFVLLNGHLNAMTLQETIYQVTTQRQLLEAAVGMAEVEVLLGSTSGGGDFGERYPDFSWSFEATNQSDYEEVKYYRVIVTLFDELSEEAPEPITFLYYNNNPDFDEGGMFSGSGTQ